jgi:cytochrome d ubiquinol oxidase subunit I
MTDLLAARSQMAMSLGFHMIYATLGIGLPALLVIAEALLLRTGDRAWRELAERWAKGTAILFAVGAVSGTVLSFELGLLWPGFMAFAGPIIGMPFSLEGFAFFFEAIFLGIYLYGADRVSDVARFAAACGVAISGAASGAFVVCANAWMNTPTGFTRDGAGAVTSVDPWAAMFNPSAPGQMLHMLVASYLATGLLAAGIHAWYQLKRPANAFHRRALAVALAVGGLATAAQPLTGHVLGEALGHNQPVKLAALEGLWHGTARAPFTLAGWPDETAEETRYAIEVPALLSLVATGTLDGHVAGLLDFPAENRPPVLVTHLAYQTMLGAMAVCATTVALAAGLALRRRRLPVARWFLWWVALSSPAGMIGIEAGWTATEVGRQPWVINGILRTADAVTPMPGLIVPFTSFTLLYLFLGAFTIALLRRQFHHSPTAEIALGAGE